MLDVKGLSLAVLEAGLDQIRQSPKDDGKVMLIVQRPDVDARVTVEECQLDPSEGVVGDNWKARGSGHTPDGSANPDMQVTIMNSRTIDLLAQCKDRWALAGDQLYVDMDLSEENLPSGTRLEIGKAVVEISAEPHTGCKKFAMRYGADATRFVNSKEGKRLHLRGVNAKVIRGGRVCVGDVARKVSSGH